MSDHMDPLEVLTHELGRVSVSPDFADRVRGRIAQAEELGLDTLKHELAEISVSPEFAVRVRQQIESAPARPRWFAFFDWRWAVPVGAAAIVAAMVLTRDGASPAPVHPDTVRAGAPQASAPSANHTSQPRSMAPQNPGQSLRTTTRVVQRTASIAAASGQQADDTIEVITYQPAVYRQLWAAAAAAQIVDAAELPQEVRDVAIVTVEVKPVAVQWLVEPPTSAGGSVPNIRRVSAEAERSSK
jgi:hypothetical protein